MNRYLSKTARFNRFLASLATIFAALLPSPAVAADLTQATVVVAADSDVRQAKAVAMLVDEVEKRTGIRWSVSTEWPAADRPVIAIGLASTVDRFAAPYSKTLAESAGQLGPEGYQLRVIGDRAAATVIIAGHDPRGVLFGVGRLLGEMRMTKGKVELADDLHVVTTPRYRLRGHQLGYRPKTNSYDAWDLPQWEQYYRDLIVFGTNAVELVPPRTDDDATSPHFPLPQLEMITGMSRLADDYGLDVWIWFPALDQNYDQPEVLAAAKKEWQEVFAAMPRLDAVLVPGGDPGHTPPRDLLSMLAQQVPGLRAHHPHAEIWISPQGFSQAWLDEFLDILRNDPPEWLTGLVYGPQVRVPLPTLRRLLPERFPIRHYPDITHTRQCQYPVPNWDTAFALTDARECINPRPIAQSQIFRLTQPHTIGFITYSEGCNDDVNKFVWSALGWDPDQPVIDILRQYSEYFIGPQHREGFAQGLLALERNWQGPLLTNPQADITLSQFQELERAASPTDLKNWRFLMGLYRAYYDAYVRRRLIRETALDAAAIDALRQYPSRGSLAVMEKAEQILRRGEQPVAAPWRARIVELADQLFETIRLQSSVPRHRAISVDRGATLDTVDFPVGNRRWLLAQFAAIRALADEAARRARLEKIVSWTNPGPGGFYDDLGNPAAQPHLVPGLPFEQDPASFESPRIAIEEAPDVDLAQAPPFPISWINSAESLYDAPLRMRYTDLDPAARYKLRIIYAGDMPEMKIRLTANGDTEIHPFITKPQPVQPLEFDLPASTTKSGQLNLTWRREPGLGRNGRGCQVAEVWLIRVR
jgi:hypothetical protein